MTNELKKAIGDIFAGAASVDARLDALVEILKENKVIEERRYGHRVTALSKSKQQFWNKLRQELEQAIEKEENSLSSIDAAMNEKPK